MTAAVEFAPGVLLVRAICSDDYTGTAEALLAAGLVRVDQLPGQPGNGLTMVSFHADGTRVPKGHPNACKAVGYLKVCRASTRLLRVEKTIGEEEYRARRDEKRERLLLELNERLALAKAWPFPVVVGRPPP